MQKFLLSFLLVGVLLFCFSQNQQKYDVAARMNEYNSANNIYQLAEKLSVAAGDSEELQVIADEKYQEALVAFTNLLPELDKAGIDSLAFRVRIKTGFIHYYLDSTHAAKKDYLAVIAFKKKLPAIADSFLFIPFLYTGSIYYNENQFDSALFYYNKAAQLNDTYQQPLRESNRLYNKLGAMYYETGNYRQARNYFEKAITLTNPAEKELINNYKINIASLLVKLGEFDVAKQYYESLLPSLVFENEIYHNLGIISSRLKEYNKAIEYLGKVNYTNNKKNIDLFYNFGVAFAELNMIDSSEFYLQRALAENIKWNGRKKNIQLGLILKYKADELLKQQLFKEAISTYQQAIMQFQYDFKDADGYINPVQFTSAFSFINLFNTLTAKAAAFESWYQQEKDIGMLKASLNAYQSAFRLAEFVEKTYDSDDARLFLGKIKYSIHSQPIDVSLQLYDLTKKRNYLEDAYLFDQQNKASILALTIQENALRSESGNTNELFRQETEIKTTITRLSLKASQLTDSVDLYQINAAIRDKEIELGRLQEKINNEPAQQRKRSLSQIPTVSQLQKSIDNTSAILSFHLTNNELLTILITPSRFEYNITAINKNFFIALESLKTALHTTSEDKRYNGTNAAMSIYEKLIAPIESKLLQTKRLIIIPDDELNYLPFEALQDENKKYLVERFSFQYQYCTALLGKNKKTAYIPGTLSFAPFASSGYKDSSGNFLSHLPASIEEVANLEGIVFADSTATKKNFLKSIKRLKTIHLATHATANNEEPSRSYISFFPGNADYKLYAQEIADLNLDSTQLVILSACETGTGKLVKGEGLMSLSRAFAYAGCPNIITSLWKAEDKTTSYITQQLHYYLDKKYTKDKALQLAKIDLLNNNDIDPRFKSPNFWAHLLFIGDYEARHNLSNWWLVGITILAIALFYTFIKRKSLFAIRKQA